MTRSIPPMAGALGATQQKKSNTTIIIIAAVAGAGALIMLLMCGGFLVGLLLPAISTARRGAEDAKAAVFMQELSVALESYLQANNDVVPQAQNWTTALQSNLASARARQSESPLAPIGGRTFAMNASMSGLTMSTVRFPDRTVVFFEVNAGGPDFGGVELLPAKPRDRSGYLMRMADGTIQHIPPEQRSALIWKP